MSPRFPELIFNPITTHIGVGRYVPLRTSTQHAAFQNRSVLPAHRYGDVGNPGNSEHMGRAKELRTPIPTQQHTYTPESRPHPTSDHTGPAAGKVPEPSAAASDDANPSPKKGKQRDGDNASLDLAKRPMFSTSMGEDEARDSVLFLISRHGWSACAGWKKPAP